MRLKMLGHIVWTIAAVGGILMSLIYVFQDKLLYVSGAPADARTTLIRPERFNIRNHEDLYISTPDGEVLNCWFLRVDDNYRQAPTMLYFHGNAGNISHRLPNIAELLRLVKVNVFIVEYRGYGKSTGTPTEGGLQLDAQAALEYLLNRADINHSKLFVFGRSLGGAVAIDLAARNPDLVKALVIENSFTSVPDMVDVVLPTLRYFKFLSRNQWSSEEKVKSLQMPTLFISGRQDELVPPIMMDRLYAACASPNKEFLPFEHGHHMDTWDQAHYYNQLQNWLKRAHVLPSS